MKNILNHWVSIIALVFSGISILLSLRSSSDNSINNSRTNEIVRILKSDSSDGLNKDSLIQELRLHGFKEDFYLNQLGIQSDWTIAYITILFGIFGLIGYAFFVQRIEDAKRETSKQIEELNKDYHTHKEQLKSLQLGFLDMTSSTYGLLFESFKEGNPGLALNLALSSIKYDLKIHNKSIDDEERNSYVKIAIEKMGFLLNYLKDYRIHAEIETYFSEDSDYKEVIEKLDSILEIKETVIKDLASEMRVLLKTILNKSTANG